MKSCLILGSGRSGTSLAAGALSSARYFMGERHWDATDANPKGFFEDRTINAINERLLAPFTPPTLPWLLGRLLPSRIGWLQRWLATVPLDVELRPSRRLSRKIEKLASRHPFCFKDPRFCYTLPAWRPHLGDTVFLCVFRDPAITVRSMQKQIAYARDLRRLRLTENDLLTLWTTMYQHVLERHCDDGTWIFSHYDQILSGECLPAWSEALGAAVDTTFADPTLRRSVPIDTQMPARTSEIYRRLCELSQFEA